MRKHGVPGVPPWRQAVYTDDTMMEANSTMASRYNIYFAGELLPDHEQASVRSNLAKLFSANHETLDLLFSGKARLLKQNCDKATALKYKQAMTHAGAVAIIKRYEEANDAPTTIGEPGAAESTAASSDLISLAPIGSDVLQESERSAPVVSQVIAAELELDILGKLLAEPATEAPDGPDTSHLSAADVGELIPTIPKAEPPAAPDTSAITLSPADTDLSDCSTPEHKTADIDLSALSLAPPESDVLEKEYRSGTPSKIASNIGDLSTE